jgi:hypothetical protein
VIPVARPGLAGLDAPVPPHRTRMNCRHARARGGSRRKAPSPPRLRRVYAPSQPRLRPVFEPSTRRVGSR